VANTLAYYDTATIMAVKCFKVEAPWAETKWEIRLFDQKKFKSVIHYSNRCPAAAAQLIQHFNLYGITQNVP
jgi:hypothetical protein